ncbi:hypothetical protein ScPMuIL_000625 [Solemya velum]
MLGDEKSPECNRDETERFEDLNIAIAWIRQEIILLRQHDILLNRQFRDIYDTIQDIKKSKTPNKLSPRSSNQTNGISDIPLENYTVRAANSITTLYENDVIESEGEDDFRPRTCSMKTVRDLTALARRRGSKDMI